MRGASTRTYRVNAIERALGLLHCVADAPRPPTLSEVAQSAQLSVPTAFRYLAILEQAGYVERYAATRRYGLGLAAAALAARVDANAGLRRVAPTVLRGHEGFQGILHLAVVRGARLHHIERLEVGARVLDKSCVGIGYDPLASVAGRALVAGLDPVQRELVVRHSPLAARGAGRAIERASASLGEHGFYWDSLDPFSGLMCLAMPVGAARGRPSLAACVTTASLRRNGEYPERLVARSAEIAGRIAHALS